MQQQRESFKRYGVWGDWENPYLTLKPEYEAAQIGVFAEMVLKGYIYRGLKPVHWSPSSKTALAEAELEYPEGHTSRSIYVALKIGKLPKSAKSLTPYLSDLYLAVWTTTPWTIPANLAVAVNPYALDNSGKPSCSSESRLDLCSGKLFWERIVRNCAQKSAGRKRFVYKRTQFLPGRNRFVCESRPKSARKSRVKTLGKKSDRSR